MMATGLYYAAANWLFVFPVILEVGFTSPDDLQSESDNHPVETVTSPCITIV